MKKIPLSPELLRGVHHLEKTDQGVMLQRMPAGVMELYQDQPGRVIRAQCPAGVRIVFITDSTTVRLPHRFGGTSREIYAFDAFIDDAPANIEGALYCGIPGVVFHGDTKLLRSQLRAAGIPVTE